MCIDFPIVATFERSLRQFFRKISLKIDTRSNSCISIVSRTVTFSYTSFDTYDTLGMNPTFTISRWIILTCLTTENRFIYSRRNANKCIAIQLHEVKSDVRRVQEKKDRTELIEENWTVKMSSISAYFSRWWLHAGRAACSAASPLAARFTPSAGEGCLLFSYASPDTILPRATTLTACVFVRY